MRAKDVMDVVSWPCKAALEDGEEVKASRSARMDLLWRRAELYTALWVQESVNVEKWSIIRRDRVSWRCLDSLPTIVRD